MIERLSIKLMIQGLKHLVNQTKERKEEPQMALKVILTEDHLMVELLDCDRIIIGTIKGVTFEDSVKIVTCTCDGSYYAFKRLMHRFILEAKHLGINVLELHVSTLDDRVRDYVDRYGFERPYGDETYLEWRVR